MIMIRLLQQNIVTRTSHLALRLEKLRFPVRHDRQTLIITTGIICLIAMLLAACGDNRVAVISQPTQPPLSNNQDTDSVASPAPPAPETTTSSPESGGMPDETAAPGNVANGEALFNGTIAVAGASPCIACHQVSGTVAVVGPNLAGIAGQAEARIAGVSAADYLHEAIVDPNSHIVEGFSQSIMPLNYADTLSEEQVADLVAYLLTLD